MKSHATAHDAADRQPDSPAGDARASRRASFTLSGRLLTRRAGHATLAKSGQF